VGGLLLVGEIALGAVRVQVVEQLPRLVRLRVQAGETQQAACVVTGVNDLGAYKNKRKMKIKEGVIDEEGC